MKKPMTKLTKEALLIWMEENPVCQEAWVFVNNNTLDFVLENAPIHYVTFALVLNPQFAQYCDRWDEFTAYDWSKVLESQPQLENKCEKWDELDSDDWSKVLASQPQLADKCDKWQMFSHFDWCYLLERQPQLAIHKQTP
jgi:hypothetical protein